MKSKKIKRTEYWDSEISRDRRRVVLRLTEEERALVATYPFTEEDLAAIRKNARKETRESLNIPWSAILIGLGIAILCVLAIVLIPLVLEFQDWLLQQDGRNIPLYAFLLCIPIVFPLAGLAAYGVLWVIAILAVGMFLYYLNIYRPGGQFHRMKREVQEDLKAELAAKRLLAARKARESVAKHDDSSGAAV